MSTTHSHAIADAATALADSAVRDGRFVGAGIAVMQRGTTLLDSAHGRASLELAVPAAPSTVYPIASITKVFTATLTMLASAEGVLGLDQNLGVVWAECPPAWSGVTLRQMLTHTSGLPDVLADPMAGTWVAGDANAALATVTGLPLQFESGTEWRYNQTNYVLLGRLLEAAYAQSFELLVSERLLAPLQLENTTYGDSSAVVPGRGPWYSRIDFSGEEPRLASEPHVAWVLYPTFARPCAGLNCTAGELARFVDALARAEMLNAETRDAMWRPQQLADQSPILADPTTRFALGWLVEELRGEDVVGGTGGASCAFRHAVGSGITVAVLTNTQGANADAMATQILELALSLG
jgi:CubicO group peptidase (beta-lactamase class C family)